MKMESKKKRHGQSIKLATCENCHAVYRLDDISSLPVGPCTSCLKSCCLQCLIHSTITKTHESTLHQGGLIARKIYNPAKVSMTCPMCHEEHNDKNRNDDSSFCMLRDIKCDEIMVSIIKLQKLHQERLETKERGKRRKKRPRIISQDTTITGATMSAKRSRTNASDDDDNSLNNNGRQNIAADNISTFDDIVRNMPLYDVDDDQSYTLIQNIDKDFPPPTIEAATINENIEDDRPLERAINTTNNDLDFVSTSKNHGLSVQSDTTRTTSVETATATNKARTKNPSSNSSSFISPPLHVAAQKMRYHHQQYGTGLRGKIPIPPPSKRPSMKEPVSSNTRSSRRERRKPKKYGFDDNDKNSNSNRQKNVTKNHDKCDSDTSYAGAGDGDGDGDDDDDYDTMTKSAKASKPTNSLQEASRPRPTSPSSFLSSSSSSSCLSSSSERSTLSNSSTASLISSLLKQAIGARPKHKAKKKSATTTKGSHAKKLSQGRKGKKTPTPPAGVVGATQSKRSPSHRPSKKSLLFNDNIIDIDDNGEVIAETNEDSFVNDDNGNDNVQQHSRPRIQIGTKFLVKKYRGKQKLHGAVRKYYHETLQYKVDLRTDNCTDDVLSEFWTEKKIMEILQKQPPKKGEKKKKGKC